MELQPACSLLPRFDGTGAVKLGNGKDAACSKGWIWAQSVVLTFSPQYDLHFFNLNLSLLSEVCSYTVWTLSHYLPLLVLYTKKIQPCPLGLEDATEREPGDEGLVSTV